MINCRKAAWSGSSSSAIRAAFTAAGLDYVSGGRFTLGLGASGPQVIEGWHGVPYDAPIGRTRELIEICRAVWRRERLDHHTKLYDIPLTVVVPASALTLVNRPITCIRRVCNWLSSFGLR